MACDTREDMVYDYPHFPTSITFIFLITSYLIVCTEFLFSFLVPSPTQVSSICWKSEGAIFVLYNSF